jgi:GNAT superfamily N-acetyltransferase
MSANAVTRELLPAEREKLLAHLVALEPEDRRLRFGHVTSDARLCQYVEGIDFARDAVFVVTDAELAVVGAAHVARADDHAELGVSVLTQARGRGVGAALLDRSANRARTWGLSVLFMTCLAENEAMLRLAHKQSLKVAVSTGEAEAFVTLSPATLTSEAAEKHAEQVGLIDHAQKSHWLALRKRWLATSQADFEQAAVRDTSGDLVSVEE